MTLNADHGELLAVVGPSGSGKTTLLRLIAGLETPKSGQVFMGNRDVTTAPAQNRQVAMVFQTLALYPHMTAAENISFSLRLQGMPRNEVLSLVSETADRLAITDCLSRRPFELSGGQRQRVALGRALIKKPATLLLDEPLTHLDSPLRRALCRELLKIHAEFSLTTVLVTHDLAEAEAMGHRIAVMNEGLLEQVGTATELRATPATPFVADFLKPDLF